MRYQHPRSPVPQLFQQNQHFVGIKELDISGP